MAYQQAQLRVKSSDRSKIEQIYIVKESVG